MTEGVGHPAEHDSVFRRGGRNERGSERGPIWLLHDGDVGQFIRNVNDVDNTGNNSDKNCLYTGHHLRYYRREVYITIFLQEDGDCSRAHPVANALYGNDPSLSPQRTIFPSKSWSVSTPCRRHDF